MTISLDRLLRALATANAAYQAALEIVEDASAVIAPADQQTLKDRVAAIRADNDEGHARLQAKLDQLIAGGANG